MNTNLSSMRFNVLFRPPSCLRSRGVFRLFSRSYRSIWYALVNAINSRTKATLLRPVNVLNRRDFFLILWSNGLCRAGSSV